MIALIQRVSEASVTVAGEPIARIGCGLLSFIAVQPQDDDAHTARMVERLLGYRVFGDEQGKMNRSLADIRGSLLLVPQFTLAADTDRGLRPSFSAAASPEQGRRRFAELVERARTAYPGRVESGRFGAGMQVALINEGPVTFWLET